MAGAHVLLSSLSSFLGVIIISISIQDLLNGSKLSCLYLAFFIIFDTFIFHFFIVFLRANFETFILEFVVFDKFIGSTVISVPFVQDVLTNFIKSLLNIKVV